MARCVKAVFDQCLQITVARTEPGSKCLDVHRHIISELILPHSVRDTTFALVESLDTTTKCAVEIEMNLSGGDSVDLSIVINTDVSDYCQQVVECLPDLHSDVFVGMEELVVVQEARNG